MRRRVWFPLLAQGQPLEESRGGKSCRSMGVTYLAFCGNTIDVCVHSTLRAAVDLDYECLLLGDCCGAVDDGLHTWAIESVKIENGVFGTGATAEAFVSAFLDGTD